MVAMIQWQIRSLENEITTTKTEHFNEISRYKATVACLGWKNRSVERKLKKMKSDPGNE